VYLCHLEPSFRPLGPSIVSPFCISTSGEAHSCLTLATWLEVDLHADRMDPNKGTEWNRKEPNKRTEWPRTNGPNGPEQIDRMDPNKLTEWTRTKGPNGPEQRDRMDLTLSDRMDPNKGTEWTRKDPNKRIEWTRTKGAIILSFGPRHSFSNFKPCNFASQPLGKLIRLGRAGKRWC